MRKAELREPGVRPGHLGSWCWLDLGREDVDIVWVGDHW